MPIALALGNASVQASCMVLTDMNPKFFRAESSRTSHCSENDLLQQLFQVNRENHDENLEKTSMMFADFTFMLSGLVGAFFRTFSMAARMGKWNGYWSRTTSPC